jgi:hypothetical protein
MQEEKRREEKRREEKIPEDCNVFKKSLNPEICLYININFSSFKAGVLENQPPVEGG